jgi:hypothetical protein
MRVRRNTIDIACNQVSRAVILNASIDCWNRDIGVFFDIFQSCCLIENSLDPQTEDMDSSLLRTYLPFVGMKRTFDESFVDEIVTPLWGDGETILLLLGSYHLVNNHHD